VRILQSPRWRRRLVWLSIPLWIAPFVYLGVHYSNPADPLDPTGPEGSFPAEPKSVPFTAAKQRAVRPVLREFIKSAVAGEDFARSWELAGPSLRAGLTRKEWNGGDLPVVPYPAADRGLGSWSFVQYSYTDTVGLEVFLFPKPDSGYSAVTADVELVRTKDGEWKVDYWLPKRFHGPPDLSAAEERKAAAAAKRAEKQTKPRDRVRTAEPFRPEQGRLGGYWWAVPLGLLSLIFGVPLLLALVIWYQNRRAQRAYLRSISRE
jgi:hypothetical protein